jgi:plastocyanin
VNWRFACASAVASLLAVSPARAKPPTRTVTVVVDKLSFPALPTNLHVGDTIIWANKDLFQHSVSSRGHFDVELAPGRQRAMILRAAGQFSFLCKYHPGMSGLLKVSP